MQKLSSGKIQSEGECHLLLCDCASSECMCDCVSSVRMCDCVSAARDVK